MAVKGLKKAVYAVMIGEQSETYGVVKKIPDGVKVTVSPNMAEGQFYAYDQLADQDSEFSDADVTIEVGENTKEMECDLLGHSLDSNGVIVCKADDKAPYVALGYQVPLSKGRYGYMWLLKLKFKQPSEEAQTKAGNFTYGTSSLTGKAQPRETDGQWRNKCWSGDAAAATWFNAPYVSVDGAIVNKGILEAAMVYKTKLSKTAYTNETWEAVETAYATAETKLNNTLAKQAEVDSAANDLVSALTSLVAA